METHISPRIRRTRHIEEAEAILRSCVHCGFCTATCPTYQLLGDELDGPRGRIYLIKQMLESGQASAATRRHLDRCLLCRACESTCPSGVRYAQLLHTGRQLAAELAPAPLKQRGMQGLLRAVLPYPRRLSALLQVARAWPGFLLPTSIRNKLPAPVRAAEPDQPAPQPRKVILFQGCVQSVMASTINAAADRVLHKLGIEALSAAGESCCGAVNHHLDDAPKARAMARNNLDRWLELLDEGADALLVTASACALEIREYPLLLAQDRIYLEKALRIQDCCREIGEFLSEENLSALKLSEQAPAIAFHAPCTLQHGLGNKGQTEALLRKIGFDVREPEDAHLCCGSAGTYSITQPRLSARLLDDKLNKLDRCTARIIATANIGCLLHLRSKSQRPVKHWIEWLDEFSI